MALKWTNSSVLALAGDKDPVASITERAREIVFDAIERGWAGPPFDPFDLALLRGIQIVASADVPEAATIPDPTGLHVEFNPNRPWPRVRFSVAHEIAHTLFPDCMEAVRERGGYSSASDSWQLEMLCNIGAAEILMPAASLADVEDLQGIDDLLRLRDFWQVSPEAALLRFRSLTPTECAVFAAARDQDESVVRLDYWLHSASSGLPEPPLPIPDTSVIFDCTAIGYTAKGLEQWGTQQLFVEAVGASPYPGSRYPRVLGIARLPETSLVASAALVTVRGDALAPRGHEPRVIVQVVNNVTANWGGGGFAAALGRKWPSVRQRFAQWMDEHHVALGDVHITRADDGITVASIVAQAGLGRSSKPRIRYAALRKGLQTVAEAADPAATFHMPRIGSGLAGGNWPVIQELVEESLVARRRKVTVYVPTGDDVQGPSQPPLLPP